MPAATTRVLTVAETLVAIGRNRSPRCASTLDSMVYTVFGNNLTTRAPST